MLARYKIYRGKRLPVDPQPAGIRQDTRWRTQHPLRPTEDIVTRYLASLTQDAWRAFRAAYLDLLDERFGGDRAPFDRLADLARANDLFIGCSCPTEKNPRVDHCHTWLALEFMKGKYPDLKVEFPSPHQEATQPVGDSSREPILDRWRTAKRIADAIVLIVEAESSPSHRNWNEEANDGHEVLVQATTRLRTLAEAGDARAVTILSCFLRAFPAVRRGADEALTLAWLHSNGGLVYDVRAGIFRDLAWKLHLARDIARACCVALHPLPWDTIRPTNGDLALVVVCEHASAILGQSYAASSSWHVIEVVSVRRTRCSGRILLRLDWPVDSYRIACGETYDYQMSSIVSCAREVRVGL